MGSMDKIKPQKGSLDAWKTRFPGNVMISDKLDGISAMLVKTSDTWSFYKRGEATEGENISYLLNSDTGIPRINLPNLNMPIIADLVRSDEIFAIRGELIMKKTAFAPLAEKYGFKAARQLVNGLLNKKTHDVETREMLRYIDFVIFEIVNPRRHIPSRNLELLSSIGWSVVPHQTISNADLTIDNLSNILIQRKSISEYEMDGLVIYHNAAIHPPANGSNPEWAFAFKMILAEQIAPTTVIEVQWNASKDGFLKPTVVFEAVNIGGTTIQYATAFNAKFIADNGIGPGAIIEILRSGDVIPYINRVLTPASEGAQMPSGVHYDWNETGVDIILTETTGHRDVEMSKIAHFIKTLGIKHFGEAVIEKLYDIGLTSIPILIRNINANTLIRELDGVKETLANKLVESLRLGVQNASLIDLAAGSGVFGRGFAIKKLAAAFAVVLPKIRTNRVDIERGHVSREIIDIVESVSGFSASSAENFGKSLPEFARFLTEIGQIDKLFTISSSSPPSTKSSTIPKIFDGKTFLFTGFRDKELAEDILARGGIIADTFVKSVTDLIIPDITTTNTKIEKARNTGIRIHIREQIKQFISSHT